MKAHMLTAPCKSTTVMTLGYLRVNTPEGVSAKPEMNETTTDQGQGWFLPEHANKFDQQELPRSQGPLIPGRPWGLENSMKTSQFIKRWRPGRQGGCFQLWKANMVNISSRLIQRILQAPEQ